MAASRPYFRVNTGCSPQTAVREYLRTHDEVASKADLRAGTDVPAWYIDQIASTDTFYTSLNHNHEYIASKHIVGHRSTHDGFWRPEVDDGFAVFHRKQTTKATRKHLAFLPVGSPDLNPIESVWKSLKWELSPLVVESADEFRALITEMFEHLTRRVSFASNWITKFLDLQKLR